MEETRRSIGLNSTKHISKKESLHNSAKSVKKEPKIKQTMKAYFPNLTQVPVAFSNNKPPAGSKIQNSKKQR